MGAHELADLARDIEANGLREPIVVHRDGRIVDGRNRYRACRLLEIDDPPTRIFDGDDAELPAFVVSMNLRRRHLDESQRAMVAAKIATLKVGRPSEKAPIGAISQAQAAQLLNVSERSVDRAATVAKRGVAQLISKVIDGELSLNAAAKIARKPHEEQRKVIQLPTPAVARARAKAEGVAVAASDGKFYTDIDPAEQRRRQEADRVRLQFERALQTLAEMPTAPAAYVGAIPDFERETVEQHLAAAFAWLNDFAKEWHHGKERARAAR